VPEYASAFAILCKYSRVVVWVALLEGTMSKRPLLLHAMFFSDPVLAKCFPTEYVKTRVCARETKVSTAGSNATNRNWKMKAEQLVSGYQQRVENQNRLLIM